MTSSYELFDVNGASINHHDLQDKRYWCVEGESIEESFVRLHGAQIGVTINPEKKKNRYAPDLIVLKDGCLGDLKTQNTPFFKARKMYEIDPTYAVVFNLKDYQRYISLYPDIQIFYWVDWHAVKFKMGSSEIEVLPLKGVWKISFSNLLEILDRSQVHSYQQRQDDRMGNAKSSFVLDIRDDKFERIL